MKGFVLAKTTITLTLTIIILIAFAPTILGTVNEVIRRGALSQAEQVAGIINVLQASPSGSSHRYILKEGDCVLKTNSVYVNFTAAKLSASKDIINYVQVEDGEIKCEAKNDKAVFIKRCGDRIKIEEIWGCR